MSRVTTDRSYDWPLHTVDRAVHSPSQDAPRAPSDRCTRTPDVAAQSAIQSRQTVSGAPSLSDSLQPLVRVRRPPACSKGLPKRRMEKWQLSGLCRLHADSAIQEMPGPIDRVGNARAGRPDVRGGGSVALSSIAHCRWASRPRDRGEGDHEWCSYAAALADAVGARERHPDHVPWRNPRSFDSSIDGVRLIGRTRLTIVMESSASGFRTGALPL